MKQQDLKKETRQILLNRILITLEISRGCSDFKPDQFRLIHDEIKVPNVTDRDTVVKLATISSNAYVRYPKDDDEKRKSDWIDLGDWDPKRGMMMLILVGTTSD